MSLKKIYIKITNIVDNDIYVNAIVINRNIFDREAPRASGKSIIREDTDGCVVSTHRVRRYT